MKRSRSERAYAAAITAVLALILASTLYPLIHVLFASLSQPSRLMGHRGLILCPQGFSLMPYRMLFTNAFILSGLANSALLIVLGTAFSLLMTALAAYVLSKRYARLNRFFSLVVVISMIFSGGLIPFYLTVKGVGLYNSLFSLIVPFALVTTNLIILRTAFEGIPPSLDESARIDGAGHLTILFRISLPLVVPTMAVLTLYYAMDKWNGWFYASVFLKDKDLYPLQLILRSLLIDGDNGTMAAGSDSADLMMLAQSIRYAAIVVGTAPVLALYPFLQRFFIRGTMAGAVKE
jgi:putative aldouronate transport system permease protein